jgi:hypothetical protein
MTLDILVVFSVLAAAAILFATNLLRSDLPLQLITLICIPLEFFGFCIPNSWMKAEMRNSIKITIWHGRGFDSRKFLCRAEYYS